MIPFRASIHRKMLVVVLSTAMLALLLTGAAMLYYDLRGFRQTLVADLTAHADVIGLAAAPAIEFGDPKTATDYLDSLRGKPAIIAAAIYSANGGRFATYAAPGRSSVDFPPIPALDGYTIHGSELDLFKRIVSGREILGTVYLKAQYDMAARLRNYSGIVGAVILLSLFAAVLISRRLQQSITRPILEIAGVARNVMARRDFGSRAARTTDDEIGTLADAFNGMLEEIERTMGERKRAEEALLDSESRLLALNADLEERVAARTGEFETANKDLEGFSYSVSHDLRAPIRAIGGFAALLAQDHAAELGDEGRRKIAVIRSETARMGQLIDDLLAFSRLGRKALEPTDLDMAAMAGSVYERLNRAESGRGAEFRLGTMPRARGDRGLFEQVWMNLLSNAIKFSAKKEHPVIEAGGIATESEHVYFVRDNGAGFDPRYQARLFGVFQRLHHDRDFPGTGVGLALVHRIVTRHGGRVWADGKPDQGATFHFSLPKETAHGGV